MNNNYNYGSYRQTNIPNNINTYNNTIENNIPFAEDILSKNKGKFLKVYMSFSDSKEWCDRIFEGYLESWGRDYILLYDKISNKRYMVWNLYIDFIEFNEPLII